MDEYKPNSNKFKTEQKSNSEEKQKMEKVISGTAKPKKKSELTKFTDVFVSEDARNVKDYLLNDIAIPSAKNTLYDLVTRGLSFILFGRNAASGKATPASKINYGGFFKGDSRQNSFSSAPRERRSTFDYDEIVLNTRGDAEVVLDTMDAAIEKYGHVSVLDLYDMVQLDAPYTADKYGWLDISSAKVVPARGGGYMLKLPRAVPLD